MSQKISITLDEQSLDFIDRQTKNRSAFINDLVLREKKRLFLQELAKAYQEQSQDDEFQAEITDWDMVVGDGCLNA
jgi:hypothetical protein